MEPGKLVTMVRLGNQKENHDLIESKSIIKKQL
jgi:hypothetical protein